ncbi:probable glucuronoxylan glucuronosyltransferase IRX7 [Tanacetum coccineum]
MCYLCACGSGKRELVEVIRPTKGLLNDMKVYVYELPSKYNVDWLSNNRCSNHLFASEVAIHNALLKSDVRTLDPSEADFFFVPVYVSCNFSTVNGFPAIGHARGLFVCDCASFGEFPFGIGRVSNVERRYGAKSANNNVFFIKRRRFTGFHSEKNSVRFNRFACAQLAWEPLGVSASRISLTAGTRDHRDGIPLRLEFPPSLAREYPHRSEKESQASPRYTTSGFIKLHIHSEKLASVGPKNPSGLLFNETWENGLRT